MTTTLTEEQKDYEAFRLLLDLWKGENPIKTTKLQVLLAVNGGLATIWGFASAETPKWVLPAVGAVVCAIWSLSIGRTAFYQRLWKYKLRVLAAKYPDDPRFQVTDTAEAKTKQQRWLRTIGGVRSTYYLIGAPILFTLAWVYMLVRMV